MFKYRLNSEKISDPSCCGSFGTCLDCMLLGIKSTLGLGFFSAFFTFQLDSLYLQTTGPQWDSIHSMMILQHSYMGKSLLWYGLVEGNYDY